MQALEERSLSGLCGNPTCSHKLEVQSNLDRLTRQQSVVEDDCLFCRYASAGKHLLRVLHTLLCLRIIMWNPSWCTLPQTSHILPMLQIHDLFSGPKNSFMIMLKKAQHQHILLYDAAQLVSFPQEGSLDCWAMRRRLCCGSQLASMRPSATELQRLCTSQAQVLYMQLVGRSCPSCLPVSRLAGHISSHHNA